MSDMIDRLNAALEGRYEVAREIGEGGMATVFLATDVRHNRNVALKVLKPELAAIVGAERFLAEIETTANLQHPHILPLFDSGEADSYLFYVMPYVEGETLRARLEREKQLPIDEAVRIATDVAEALHSAHEQGVIHRDVKPANILLSKGRPLVADYGIAFAVSAAGGGRMTETGLSMGTPYYMSPEQASADREPSAASDVYSLGCVLYEMLVGEPPYVGSSAQAVLAKILMGEAPSPTTTRPSIPVNVDAAVRKALEKLPADRFAGAADFARALGDAGFRHAEAGSVTNEGPAGPWKRLTFAAGVLALVASTVAGWSLLRTQPEVATGPVARFESPFREGQAPLGGNMELTRDGSAVVFVRPAESDGGFQLWIRSWRDIEARPIPGTEDIGGPGIALSPDGSEVAYFTRPPGRLRVVSLTGGPGRTLVEGRYGHIAWSQDGWLYYHSMERGINRVRSSGGAAEVLSELSEGESEHSFPYPLPGGQTVLFQLFRSPTGSDAEVWALDLTAGTRKAVTAGNSPHYAASGHLLFATASGTLMAARFDAERAELTGEPVALVEDLAFDLDRAEMRFSVSDDGTLLYWAGGVLSAYEFVWASRSGEITPVAAGETFTFGTEGNAGWRLSPDGDRIAFRATVDGNEDIWIKELPTGPVSRLTFSELMDAVPQWAPDGRSVTYRSGPAGQGSLWSKNADGTGAAQLVFDEFDVAKGVWSPDGEWLVVRRAGVVRAESARDILAIRLGVDSMAIPLVATVDFWEQAPAISRDGRWLAYSSNETGRNEVFVVPFPDVDAGKWQVSTDGGIQPVWAHNGRELFFAEPQSRELKVASFTTTTSTFQRAQPTTLFEIPPDIYVGLTGNTDFYDVAPDGERFLMAEQDGRTDSRSLILVQNFFEELRRLVPN